MCEHRLSDEELPAVIFIGKYACGGLCLLWASLHLDRTPQSKTLQLFKLEHWLYSAENFDAIHVLHQQEALLLDLPSESEGKDLVHIIYCYYPLNIKAKLLQAILHYNKQ